MKLLILLGSFFLLATAAAQSGKYAGTKKSLIGKEFTQADSLPALNGWKHMEGTVMNVNVMTDPELHMVDVFKKGTTWLIIFSVREDTAVEKNVVSDVVEVTGVLKGWSVHTGSCSQNNNANSYIVALGKDTTDEYMKVIKKAWQFDPDKRRVIILPVKGIKCENIGC